MTQFNVRFQLFRLSLLLGFFLTCVLLPLLRVMPFFEVRAWFVGIDYTMTVSYFFDYNTYEYNHEMDHTRHYIEYDSTSVKLLAVSGWIMILLGTLVLCAAAWVFYRENLSLKPYHFPPLVWFSILSVVSFLFEWFLIIIIMIQEPWSSGTYLIGPIFHPPALNLPLFGIMLLGQICLVLVNNLGKKRAT